MNDNRGMSPQQARALARDPKTSPGIFTRLANGYPEVWSDLLENPSLPADLHGWIVKAIAQKESELSRPVVAKAAPAPKSTKTRNRGRLRAGRFVRTVGLLIIPVLAVMGLAAGIQYLKNHRPVVGVLNMQNLSGVDSSPAWKYDLSSGRNSACTQYQIGTLQQGQVVVLTQNDIEKKACKNRSDIRSTLALVQLSTGKALWKVDLSSELDWTQKWHKQLVEVIGLNEILVKYTDVNGSDAGGNVKSIDKGDDRKMKTIVPYNRLNGVITDPVIAKSKSQPIMQAPVLQVLAIPGNLKSVLVMTNGAKKDFRYAKYRSKRFSSARWSVESDMKPVGGAPIVDQKLILGRSKTDMPLAINLARGKFERWNGNPGVKLYRVGNQQFEVLGDGVAEKATNLTSQGGIRGHKITINAIDSQGNLKWSLKSKGYAISRDDSSSNTQNRNWYSRLFVLGGKYNQFVSLVNPTDGSIDWRTKISQQRFEISRNTAGNRVAIYLYKKFKLDTKTFSMLNLQDGKESKAMPITGKAVRVDGATAEFSILVDEPDRTRIIKDAEAGKISSLSRKDHASQKRKCAQGVENTKSEISWTYTCNGNQHLLRAGGSWLLLDLTPGTESFWKMKASN